MTEALYHPDAEWFVPTDATRSPWHAAAQHGGPPAALAVRAIERLSADGLETVRLRADFLREVPFAPLKVEAETLRAGRRVALLRATVSAADGPVLLASAWVVRSTCIALPDAVDDPPTAPPHPETLPILDFSFRDYPDFFGTAVEKRLISGNIQERGRAALWFRLRLPLVAGEPPSPLQQLVTMADSGNGISWAVPFESFVFVNIDLDLLLARAPQGDWYALDAVSYPDSSGRGVTEASLFDTSGWLGRSTQALFVARR